MFLAFFPVQALSKPTVCEAHSISNYQVLDKHYITFQINLNGRHGFRLFYKDPFGWPVFDVATSDHSYNGTVKIVLTDYQYHRLHLAIQCK